MNVRRFAPRLLVVAVAALALSACVNSRYVTADITRFHTLPAAAPVGQTFAIVALDRGQEQSLEYRQYADLLNAKLTALGLKQAAGGPGEADYVVTLDYGVDGPTPDVRTRNTSVNVGMGYGWGGRRNWGWGGFAYDPFYDNDTTTENIYTRHVELDIYRGKTYATPKPERVFEGRALSEGVNGQLLPVMPYILDALFTDFPGASGTTKTVQIQLPTGTTAERRGNSNPRRND